MDVLSRIIHSSQLHSVIQALSKICSPARFPAITEAHSAMIYCQQSNSLSSLTQHSQIPEKVDHSALILADQDAHPYYNLETHHQEYRNQTAKSSFKIVSPDMDCSSESFDRFFESFPAIGVHFDSRAGRHVYEGPTLDVTLATPAQRLKNSSRVVISCKGGKRGNVTSKSTNRAKSCDNSALLGFVKDLRDPGGKDGGTNQEMCGLLKDSKPYQPRRQVKTKDGAHEPLPFAKGPANGMTRKDILRIVRARNLRKEEQCLLMEIAHLERHLKGLVKDSRKCKTLREQLHLKQVELQHFRQRPTNFNDLPRAVRDLVWELVVHSDPELLTGCHGVVCKA